jgi:hypothetical protein
MKKAAFWLPLVAAIFWIGIGLRDLLAPNLFNFSGRTASSSTMILDFVTGAIFLFVALTFRKAKN